MDWKNIEEAVRFIKDTLPPHVLLVAAAKTRTADEIRIAIDAGIDAIGENYVQEAERVFPEIGNRVQWHLIGHLQRNKVKKAVRLFDMIETIDSVAVAGLVDKRCREMGKVMPVLIEINSGRESSKTGVLPDELDEIIGAVSQLSNLRIMGLMTMGPGTGDPEDARPYFRATKQAFDRLKSQALPNTEMRYLSMGMSNSYRVAVEEGANIVRIGSLIFGERKRQFRNK